MIELVVAAFAVGVIVGSWLTQWAIRRWPPNGVITSKKPAVANCCDGNRQGGHDPECAERQMPGDKGPPGPKADCKCPGCGSFVRGVHFEGYTGCPSGPEVECKGPPCDCPSHPGLGRLFGDKGGAP